jgi:site-specific DNA recombinase
MRRGTGLSTSSSSAGSPLARSGRPRRAGIELRAVHDGKADQIQIGIRGLVGALYLQDLAHKVRRGMSGVIRDGRHAGGRAYGYRPVPGKPGELQIDEDEVAIVPEIFESYVGGKTPREIAMRLNVRRVPPPRGRYWTASTLNGSLKRHNGVIQNDLYAGRIVWNKVRMIKDPDTGKRVSRPNPESEWQSIDAPYLRIVGQELFERAIALKQERGGPIPCHTRKPKRVSLGSVEMRLLRRWHVRQGHKERTATHPVYTNEGPSQERAIIVAFMISIRSSARSSMKANLTTPDLIAAYVETYNGAQAARFRADRQPVTHRKASGAGQTRVRPYLSVICEMRRKQRFATRSPS